uniref:uncharacterized protein LOC120347217 n=1 Tax=Styela clava TaxID=7725 RepID=UPI00193A543A|nr:uncharacterized protein LOC120347217 [Styela clava]
MASRSSLLLLRENRTNQKASSDIVDLLNKASLTDSCEGTRTSLMRQRSSPASFCSAGRVACNPISNTHSTLFQLPSEGRILSQLSPMAGLASRFHFLPILLDNYMSQEDTSVSSNCVCDLDFPYSTPVYEDLIELTAASCLESNHKFSALLRDPDTDAQWGVTTIRENAKIEASSSFKDTGLYGWKLGDNTYVFGFQDEDDKVYYVRASSRDASTYPYLLLSSNEEDPAEISDTASDYRCFSLEYDGSSQKYHLRPAHHELTGHWVDFFHDSEKLLLTENNMENTTAWQLN